MQGRVLRLAGHSTSEDQNTPVMFPASLDQDQDPGCQDQALSLPPRCPSQVARSVSVHGYGYLTLALKDVPGLRDFYSGFSFRTSQHEGLLYHHSTQVGSCSPPVSQQQGRNFRSCSGNGAAPPLGILVGPGGESPVRSAP